MIHTGQIAEGKLKNLLVLICTKNIHLSVIVHLFEWKWADIALECEHFLAPKGFAGVQVSPPTENSVIESRPWWERFQPVSYKVDTRSGTEAEFLDMTRRCNAVGIRIYVDLVINHMSATTGMGTAGSTANEQSFDYPAVPYTSADFHKSCEIDENDTLSIRSCQLYGLPDLDQSNENVRAKIVEMMNHLIELGVAGFRVGAIKHMEPEDLQNIFGRLNNLNVEFGFAADARAFIIGQIDVHSNDLISGTEYFSIGIVTEFRFSNGIAKSFRGQSALKWLNIFGEGWGMFPSDRVFTFVDNHDSQRDGALNYKDGRLYKMATAFHLAWPYGIPRVMSSFEFLERDQGPPQDLIENLLSPTFNADGSCNNGWVCEHRWIEIANMVGFRNIVRGTNVSNWWDNGDNQIAFARGNRGFIAFNGQSGQNLSQRLQTDLSGGTYCDIISGSKVGNVCSGASFLVASDGQAEIKIPSNHATGVIAFHADSRL